MDRKLKKQLKKIAAGHRPRPLMYVGMRGSKRCYVRKHSLSYFQLLKKLPSPAVQIKISKPWHIFQKRHHLAPLRK